MTAFISGLRWDIVIQARNGFYWATGVLLLIAGGFLLAVPEAARANGAALVPALLVVNLQITTFFFVAGLMLLEREEGTLNALAVSPLSPGEYLATHTLTLTALAAAETVALIWLAFDTSGSWLLLLTGTAALGVIYTGSGAGLAARYASVNTLLLPASAFVTMLLLPLLPHFGLGPRTLVLLHPVEPALTLLRAAYGVAGPWDLSFGIVGSVFWCAVAFSWGRSRVAQVMHDVRAGGGR